MMRKFIYELDTCEMSQVKHLTLSYLVGLWVKAQLRYISWLISLPNQKSRVMQYNTKL